MSSIGVLLFFCVFLAHLTKKAMGFWVLSLFKLYSSVFRVYDTVTPFTYYTVMWALQKSGEHHMDRGCTKDMFKEKAEDWFVIKTATLTFIYSAVYACASSSIQSVSLKMCRTENVTEFDRWLIVETWFAGISVPKRTQLLKKNLRSYYYGLFRFLHSTSWKALEELIYKNGPVPL